MKHYLVLTPLILFSFTAFGNENTLEKDEALLIIGIYSSNITAIHFKEVDTGESFSVRRDISRTREPKPGSNLETIIYTLLALFKTLFLYYSLRSLQTTAFFLKLIRKVLTT